MVEKMADILPFRRPVPKENAALTDELTCEVRRILSARHLLTYREYESQLETLREKIGDAKTPGAHVAMLLYESHHHPARIPDIMQGLLVEYSADRGYLLTALKVLDTAPVSTERNTAIPILERLLEE